MKLKQFKYLNLLILLFVSIFIFFITSCSVFKNPFDSYDSNTNITLQSKNQAKNLFNVAKTKLRQIKTPSPIDAPSEKPWASKIFNCYNPLTDTYNEEEAKDQLYWEIALNISQHGKTWKFNKNDASTFLSFTIISNDWFSISMTTGIANINNIQFDYFDKNKTRENENIGSTNQTFNYDYSSLTESDGHWMVANTSSNEFLFISWVMWDVSLAW